MQEKSYLLSIFLTVYCYFIVTLFRERRIHARCVEHGESNGRVDYVRGANIAGFKKVADAMLAYGVF